MKTSILLRSLRQASFAGFSAITFLSSGVAAPAPISEQEAHAIAVDAYIYFYSLVTMDITRKQFTNIEAGRELGKGPMNMFVSIPQYPPADFKGVVHPNFDTLYSPTSRSWLG